MSTANATAAGGSRVPGMVEVVYLVMLIAAFAVIGVVGMYIVYRLFAGRR